MVKKDYKTALTQFSAIVVHETKEVDKLSAYLNIARCFICLSEFKKAEEKCIECTAIFNTLIDGECSMPKEKRNKCDEAIQKLIDEILFLCLNKKPNEKILRDTNRLSKSKTALQYMASTLNRRGNNKAINLALQLIENRSKLIQLFYKEQPELFLPKLSDCGRQIEDLFRKGAKTYQTELLEEHSWIKKMENTLEILQSIVGIDVETKAQYVARFYHSFAVCFYKIKKNDKANELCLQAVAVLKTVFAFKASDYKVMSFCYYLLGCVETRRKEYKTANSLFQQALKSAEEADDWNLLDSNEKTQFLEKTSQKLKKAEGNILILPTAPPSRRLSFFQKT